MGVQLLFSMLFTLYQATNISHYEMANDSDTKAGAHQVLDEALLIKLSGSVTIPIPKKLGCCVKRK